MSAAASEGAAGGAVTAGMGAAASGDPGTLRWGVQEGSRGAAADLDWAMQELDAFRTAAAQGEHLPDLLRVYVPQPTLAFGQRDTRLPGYAAAVEASREHGFEPLIRRAGGRAAAYHHGCVVVDHLALEQDAGVRQQARFSEFAELFVRAFARVGVKASVGEIPGEYCPGEFSVQGPAPGHPVKLAGSAQRVVKGAWLFSTHVVVADAAPLGAVLTDVYGALGIQMDPRTVGAAEDVHPGASVDGFVAALRAEYADWAAERGLGLTDVTVR